MTTHANRTDAIIKTRKRRRRIAGRLYTLLLALLFSAAALYSISFTRGVWKEIARPQFRTTVEATADLNLHSTNALLLRLDPPKQVLLEQRATEQVYPASMSKIMTAVVALEHLDNLEERIALSGEMYAGIYAANAATAGYLPGEEVTAIDLLYGLLLPSGAECAIGLAEHVAGSERAFVDRMNQRAAELGMNGTHFANATGLHDPGHYTTLRDLAALLEHAFRNDVFYGVFTSARHSGSPTNLHPDGITVHSTLFSKINSAGLGDGVLLGGKTGYTDQAGQCLASLAEIEGVRYLLITSGAPGDRLTQTLHIDDALAVYTRLAADSKFFGE